jgi:uncharacterized protein (DUF58 family)
MSELRRNPELWLKRLEWTVLRRLDGLLQGDYRTLFRGFGLDLADLREYQYHDDVRHIDWNVTARMSTPYVREYHEDREVTAWFLVDLSGSVRFGSRDVRKSNLAIDFVGLLARLLTRHGNRVGAVIYGDGMERVVRAATSRRHVLHIVHELMSHPERASGSPTDLRAFIDAALHFMPRRSLVFVLSDFISVPGWGRSLAQLAQRHETLAVRLHDPLERNMPDLGLVVVQDAETGEQLFVDTHDRGFRKRFAAAAEKREQALRSAFTEAGVDALELSTGDDLVDAILRYADMRRRRSRLPSAAATTRGAP